MDSIPRRQALKTDPKGLIDELHAQHFRVVLHNVILTRTLRGAVQDPCTLSSKE